MDALCGVEEHKLHIFTLEPAHTNCRNSGSSERPVEFDVAGDVALLQHYGTFRAKHFMVFIEFLGRNSCGFYYMSYISI